LPLLDAFIAARNYIMLSCSAISHSFLGRVAASASEEAVGRRSSVFVLSLVTTVNCGKTADLTEMPIWDGGSGGPKEPCIR